MKFIHFNEVFLVKLARWRARKKAFSKTSTLQAAMDSKLSAGSFARLLEAGLSLRRHLSVVTGNGLRNLRLNARSKSTQHSEKILNENIALNLAALGAANPPLIFARENIAKKPSRLQRFETT